MPKSRIARPASITCIYCSRPAFSAGLSTNLCENHLDLWLIISHLRRLDINPTLNAIAHEMRLREEARDGFKFSFTPEQIPALLEQMRTEDWAPLTTHAGVLMAA